MRGGKFIMTRQSERLHHLLDQTTKEMLEHEERQQMFARLNKLAIARREEIKKDPFKFLRERDNKIYRLMKALVEMDRILFPPPKFVPDNAPIEFISQEAEMLMQLNQLRELITQLRNKENF